MRTWPFFTLLLTLCGSTAHAVIDPAAVIFPQRERQGGGIFPGLGQPQGDQHAYTAPNNLFSIELPVDWEPHTFPNRPDFVEVRMKKGSGSGTLQIKRTPVTSGAHPKQLLLRALEQRLSKLVHFEETDRHDVTINGLHGVSISGTFWFQGNAQYPRAFEDIFLVVGQDAFELHFECFAPFFEQFGGFADKIYQTFIARPPVGGAPRPAAGDKDDLDNGFDDLPF